MISLKVESVCFICQLPECDDNDPGCALFKGGKNSAQKKYYQNLRKDLERFKKYQEKKREIKKKWLNTPEGKRLWNAQVKRYRKKNPEVMREAYKRYHEKNKEKRNAYSREYKKRMKAIKGNQTLELAEQHG